MAFSLYYVIGKNNWDSTRKFFPYFFLFVLGVPSVGLIMMGTLSLAGYAGVYCWIKYPVWRIALGKFSLKKRKNFAHWKTIKADWISLSSLIGVSIFLALAFRKQKQIIEFKEQKTNLIASEETDNDSVIKLVRLILLIGILCGIWGIINRISDFILSKPIFLLNVFQVVFQNIQGALNVLVYGSQFCSCRSKKRALSYQNVNKQVREYYEQANKSSLERESLLGDIDSEVEDN